MSSRLFKLADRFETKLRKFAQKVSQRGTTELFFGSGSKQELFAKKVQNQNSEVSKIMLKYFNDTEKSCSFSLEEVAEPKKGAKWILTVKPIFLKSKIQNALNSIYESVMKKSMSDAEKEANEAAKKENAGSGENHVVDLSFF